MNKEELKKEFLKKLHDLFEEYKAEVYVDLYSDYCGSTIEDITIEDETGFRYVTAQHPSSKRTLDLNDIKNEMNKN